MDVGAVYRIGAVVAVQTLDLAVGQFFYLGDHADHIHAEAIDAFVTPPGHHVKDLLAYLRVIPVQVRLFFGKQVQVVHGGCFIVFPCGTAEAGAPVVGWGLGVLPFPPDVVVAVRVVRGFAAFHEPFVLVGGVVHHQVHDDLDASLMGSGQ